MDQKTPAGSAASASTTAPKHVLPPLPYDYAALEPWIDARTMTVHHDKHHATYVDKLNAALEPHAELRNRSVPWLLTNLEAVPQAARAAVRNNGGGHLNHSLFWQLMAPKAGGEPTGALAAAIDQVFGGFEQFKTRFDEAAASFFGSGWVWLVLARGNNGGKPGLEVVTTAGHDNPIQQGKYPLLLNDVWEHAYYLKYENRRPEYLKNWWSVVNWKNVAQRFEHPDASTELEPADGFLAGAAKSPR